MGKSTPATSAAPSRDQFDPGQKAQKSAVLVAHITPQPQHDVVMDIIPYAIDLPQLAAALGANPRSLRNAFYLRPEDFPPAIYLPGCRGPRFLVDDVQAWLESQKTQRPKPPAPPAAPKPQGRPRKASALQIARARKAQGGAA